MRSTAARAHDAERLIRAAHESVFAPAGMTLFAARLAEIMHGTVVLCTNGGDAPGVRHVDACVGLSPASLAAYRDHYCRISPWNGWIASAPRSAVGAGRSVNPLDRAAYERTEFYCDFLRPNDLHHGMGARVESGASIHTDIAMVRARAAGEVGTEEVEMMRRVLPHVRAALRARRLCTASGWSPARLDTPDLGVLLADRRGRLLFANARGTLHLLDDAGAISARSRELTARDPAAASRLSLVIGRALGGCGGDLLLPRAGAAALRVTAVPIPPRTDAFGGLDAACMLLLRERGARA